MSRHELTDQQWTVIESLLPKRRRGIKPMIPIIERRRHWPKLGRPIRPGPSYCDRWKVERCFAWMDNCRPLVLRYEYYVEYYKAFCLPAIILWCLNLILK